MKIEPTKCHMSITKRKPRKLRLEMSFNYIDDNGGKIDVQPLVRGFVHYGKLLAREISAGLWDK